MKLMQRIEPNISLPKFWGMAWYDFVKNQVVLMPIPLNIIASLLRNLYIKLGCFGQWDIGAECYRKGYEEGYQSGRAKWLVDKKLEEKSK